MLEAGPTVGRLAAVPLLIFSAPYLIMRNTLRGGPLERRRGEVVMVATVIAGLWSLMSGTVVVMALQALLSVDSHSRRPVSAHCRASGYPSRFWVPGLRGDERSSSACGFAHDL